MRVPILGEYRRVLETTRLLMLPWQFADWLALRPIAQDPEVMRYITGGVPWTDDQIRGFVDRQVQLYNDRGYCRWKLVEKATARMVGFCGVGYWRNGLEPEIGWWLARQHWGQGLASEAGRAALGDAFERVGLPRIISVAMAGNLASRRIMEKLGLHLESEFENDGFQLVRYAISAPGDVHE